jgi:LytS/YehU family sensor histidine kinase
LNKTLIFIVENTKNNAKTENGGIGLVNVKRRLDILFPQNHNLEIADSDDIYKVKLTINLEQ